MYKQKDIDPKYLIKEDQAIYKARSAGKLAKKQKRYKLIDLFSGAGGMTLGFSTIVCMCACWLIHWTLKESLHVRSLLHNVQFASNPI